MRTLLAIYFGLNCLITGAGMSLEYLKWENLKDFFKFCISFVVMICFALPLCILFQLPEWVRKLWKLFRVKIFFRILFTSYYHNYSEDWLKIEKRAAKKYRASNSIEDRVYRCALRLIEKKIMSQKKNKSNHGEPTSA